MIFDTHAHYDHGKFNDDRGVRLSALYSEGVSNIINIGSSMGSSKRSVCLAEEYEFIYATVGVHPHEAKTLTDNKLQELEQLAKHKKVIAIGEIGLDYHYNHSPQDIQIYWFKSQLALSERLDMPVVIHSRESDDDVFQIIMDSNARKGIIHSFSSTAELALEYIKLGFYIGIGGVITFDKTGRLQDVVSKIPLESILLETDAPYLTPAPHRGKRNESPYLIHVAEKIAKIKKTTCEQVINTTYENAKKFVLLKNI